MRAAAVEAREYAVQIGEIAAFVIAKRRPGDQVRELREPGVVRFGEERRVDDVVEIAVARAC